MNVRDLIDGLAALDEAAPAQPEVDPDVMPDEPPTAPPAPSRPAPQRRPSHNPYSVPPDFDPTHMPRPKAGDETESIESWLEVTQQPIQDWEWNGQELNLLMDDGSTETYTREQLDDIGVFGEMSMAESVEDPQDILPGDPEAAEPETEQPAGAFIEDDNFELPPDLAQHLDVDDSSGTLDTILGRNGAGDGTEAGPEAEVIHIEGEAANDLGQAVSDVVSAILGAVTNAIDGESGESNEGESDESNEGGDETDEKIDGKDKPKKKNDSEKSDDSDSNETDEKDDAKEGDKEDDKED